MQGVIKKSQKYKGHLKKAALLKLKNNLRNDRGDKIMNVEKASILYMEKFGQEFPFYDLMGEDDT